MKPIFFLLAPLVVAACARPVYVARSDANKNCVHGSVRQISETLFNRPDLMNDPAAVDPFDTRTVIDYNRAGNITRLETFRLADSTLVAKEEYFYDPTGRHLQRALTYSPPRSGAITVLHNYDEAGREVSEVESNGLWRLDRTYDRHGYPRRLISTEHGSDKKKLTARYRYDSRGRLKRIGGERRRQFRYHPDGTLRWYREWDGSVDLYNERGHLVSSSSTIRHVNERGRVRGRHTITITAEYEYDGRGNWIRRTQLYQGLPQTVALRRIDYFDYFDD